MTAKNMRILKPIKKHIYELTPDNKKNIYQQLGVKNQTELLKTKFKHQHPVKKNKSSGLPMENGGRTIQQPNKNC